MANIEFTRQFILASEGGFSNNVLDSGGATNKGITLGTFRYYYGSKKTVNDLKNITDKQWLDIFRRGYWNKWKADEIVSDKVALVLVDWIFNSGSACIRPAQQVIGTTADGIVGPQTIAKINSQDSESLYRKLMERRNRYYVSIVKNKSSQLAFLEGWENRLLRLAFYAK